MSIRFELNIADNCSEFQDAAEDAILRALERCGLQAEGYAKDLCPHSERNNLKNSITHIVDPQEKAAYIGTDVKYAPYVEMGTGIHAEGGGGRPGWWVYVKDSSGGGSDTPQKTYTYQEAVAVMMALRRKGLDAYMTQGQKPQPFLKPAVEDHAQTYRDTLKDEMENA